MPIMAGMKEMPPASSLEPKVKRGVPISGSRPTCAMKRPRSSERTPLAIPPVETSAAHERPSTASQKYSNEEKLSANLASAGAATIRTQKPISPPMQAEVIEMPMASPALPCFVRPNASST